MPVEHSAIADPEIHEPKGIAAAVQGKVYVSDGASSGSWRYIPHSALYYDDIGTGTTLTTPTAYTLVAPTTVADAAPHEFTHNSLGRLLYTGIETIDVNLRASITIKHSSATLVDTFFQFFNKGVAITGAQHATAALSGNYTHVSLTSHVSLDTNDYIEVYAKTASGNIVVHALSMTVEGKL